MAVIPDILFELEPPLPIAKLKQAFPDWDAPSDEEVQSAVADEGDIDGPENTKLYMTADGKIRTIEFHLGGNFYSAKEMRAIYADAQDFSERLDAAGIGYADSGDTVAESAPVKVVNALIEDRKP